MLEMSSRTELIVVLYIHEQVPITFLFVCLLTLSCVLLCVKSTGLGRVAALRL